MASVNKVLIAGNLTREPEIRYTPSGTAVCDLGLAINEKFKDKGGDVQEKTVFVDAIAWGRQAETCSEHLLKGSAVLVEGRLQLDQWENQQGEKRQKLRVRADRVHFLGSPKKEGKASAPRQTNGPSVADDEDIPF